MAPFSGSCFSESPSEVAASRDKRSEPLGVELGQPVMANATISIRLDAQTAEAYGAAPSEEKVKIEALVSLWLRELTAGDLPSLQQVLDEAGRKAQERGLTPEILDSILKGD